MALKSHRYRADFLTVTAEHLREFAVDSVIANAPVKLLDIIVNTLLQQRPHSDVSH